MQGEKVRGNGEETEVVELTLELMAFLSLAVKNTKMKKKILFFNSNIADVFSLHNSMHLLHEVI